MAPSGLGLAHPVGDLAQVEQVGAAPEVERQRALGEGAELALEGAHVGVVDVPVGHVGDLVADGLDAQLVGHLGHGPDLGAPGAEQGDDLVLADDLTVDHAGQHVAHRPTRPTVTAGGDRGAVRADPVGMRRRAGRAAAPRHPSTRGGRGPVPRRPRRRARGSAWRRPATGRGRGRTPGTGSAGAPGWSRPPRWPRRRSSRAGQARSGFTWSAVTGETPPQSSIPEASRGARSSERLGGACRWMSGGRTNRATAMVHRNSSVRARRVTGAWPCPPWAGSSG